MEETGVLRDSDTDKFVHIKLYQVHVVTKNKGYILMYMIS